MSRLWHKDGLSRKQRLLNAEVPGFFRIFENDVHILTGRAMEIARILRYFNLENQPEGYFNEVLEKNAFVILTRINLWDVDGEKKLFLNFFEHDYYEPEEKCGVLIARLLELIQSFDLWLHYIAFSELNGARLSLHKDLRNQISVNLKLPAAQLSKFIEKDYPELPFPPLKGVWRVEGDIPRPVDQPLNFLKSTFYRLINSLKLLQENSEMYYQEIITAGNLDPSMSLLVAFFKNYSVVTEAFNRRWQAYPDFYLNHILKATPQDIVPDCTFLMFKKSATIKTVFLDKGTEFIGGKDLQGRDIRYRSLEEMVINNVSLEKVYSLYLEQDTEIVPAGEFNYVTAIRKSEVSHYIDVEPGGFLKSQPQPLFENKGKKSINEMGDVIHYTSVGMMIESWVLLLQEGVRNVTVKFMTTSKTAETFQKMIRDISKQWDTSERETTYKILNDIFYLEISTGEGWSSIANYSVDYKSNEEGRYLQLRFSLHENYPPTTPCSEIHSGAGLCHSPVLKILINRDTWLFPFSWLKDFEMEKIRIEVDVSGVTQLQIYNELGQLDNSKPFYPFGVIPRKGSWLVVGNYEMAMKKVKSFDLNLKWLQLPGNDYGFCDYYQHYGKEINNCSFKVKAQALYNRKWEDVAGGKSFFLFNTLSLTNEIITLPQGTLSEYSSIAGIQLPDFGIGPLEEEKFRYNMFAKGGFIRLALSEPEMGFGHMEYQRLLSDTLIQKARSKNLVPMPKPPFSPQLEKMELNYHSEDEIKLLANEMEQKNKIYYLFPLGERLEYPRLVGKRLKFLPDLGSRGNLLFGLKNVKGGETIRLFIDFLPREREIDKRQFPTVKWFLGDGYDWTMLSEQQILVDTTRHFLESGLIEIRLPKELPDHRHCVDGLHWLRAGIEEHVNNVSHILGFYLNVAKVQLDVAGGVDNTLLGKGLPAGSITKAVRKIPGISEIVQIVPSWGGRIREDRSQTRIRLSERISHRHRAVTAADYEKMVLEAFPQVQKVKCLPGLDSKGQRRGVVTVVVFQKQPPMAKQTYPKANCKLLLDIEEYLGRYAGSFAIVDAINPVYEEIQVRCKVKLREVRADGYFIRKLNKLVNEHIAFWQKTGDSPVFGHSIALTDLANLIRGEEYVEYLSNFSVLHLKETGDRVYQLQEFEEFAVTTSNDDEEKQRVRQLLNEKRESQKEIQQISPSQSWAILVPAYRHLIVTDKEEQNDKAGIDDLELGNTFVIG